MSLTVDESLRFADQQYTKQSFAGVLAAEVRRLTARIDAVTDIARQRWPEIVTMEDGWQAMARSRDDAEVELKKAREQTAVVQVEVAHGDCESVQWQWDESFAHQELVDELQPVMTLTWEVHQLRAELAQERKRLDWALANEAVYYQWGGVWRLCFAPENDSCGEDIDTTNPRATIDELIAGEKK